MNGDVVALAQALKRYPRGHFISIDASSFDESISGETYDLAQELFFGPVAQTLVGLGVITKQEADLSRDVSRALVTLPMLSPSPVEAEAVRLVPRYGRVISGARDTSNIDTVLQQCAGRTLLAELGTKGVVFNFGDDTVLLRFDRPWAEGEAAELSRHGLNYTSSPVSPS